MDFISARRAYAAACCLSLVGVLTSACAADPTATTAPTPTALSGFVLSATSVAAGSSVNGTLTLSATAPAGGAVITLASSTTVVTIPAKVTIPEGSTVITFPVTTTSAAASSVITATYGGASLTATLVTTVVTVSTLQNLFLSTNVGSPGTVVLGTITLTSPAPAPGLTVSLTATPGVNVPATIVVPLGNTSQTFQAEVGSTNAASATVTASAAGVVRSAALTIGQLALSLDLTSVAGGVPVTGRVTLPTPAPDAGALISLASNSPVASVPPLVVVPPGATAQTFSIATSDSPPTIIATITASYAGVIQTSTLVVVAYPVIASLACTPAAVSGGTPVQCNGTLTSAAPASGWRLSVATSSPSVAGAAVTVAPSAQTFTFTLQTAAVTAATPVSIQVFDGASGFLLWTVGFTVNP